MTIQKIKNKIESANKDALLVRFIEILLNIRISAVVNLIMRQIRIIFLSLLIVYPVMAQTGKSDLQKVATLGGGCFWCIEAVFKEVRGVERVESGYSGGKTANPTYREVCSGLTGHAEAVRIFFNPAIISYAEILTIFFSVHDPTTLNRQGADVGTQYRSVIFYHDEEQKKTAEQIIAELEKKKVFNNPVVTELVPAGPFYIAEDYHQNYFENNPSQPYCQVVINPKMDKFRKAFRDKLKRQ
ncbi:MAG: peptide-methionine (S)-S-oxide reductase [Anaerophaga sp.]|nr:peptide-methionine (S)-S-oxide reductase [Anaerophaga sp.]